MIAARVTIVLLFAVVQAVAQVEKGDILIRNGTVLTITKGTIQNADVLVRSGVISKIGKNLKAPEGCRIIDATGLYVMPGIIDAHSHIAMDAINEGTNPVTAEICTGDGLNPLDIAIYRALSGGVTIIHALHGSANPIGGESETIKLRYGTTDPEVLKMKDAPRTIKFALGENPTRIHGSNHHVIPRTRMGVEFILRKALTEAREYMAAWDKYNKDKAKKGFRGMPPDYSLRMETLADVLRGEVIIHCHSYRADEILMLLKVCKDFGIKKIVFQHANEGFKVAPEMAAQGAMASVFSDWWAYKFEVYYSTAYNAAILVRNGVTTSINSDNPSEMCHLYLEASKTQRYGGLTQDEALAMITINPAIQLGIEKRVGSLEEGKDGDIAIFRNHPLSVYTIPRYTIIDGIVRFDSENDPDDMRIYIDLHEPLDKTYSTDSHSAGGCMRGAFQLFEEEK